jgi:hypothetical protein
MPDTVFKFNISEKELKTKMRNSKVQEIPTLKGLYCSFETKSNGDSSFLIIDHTFDLETKANLEHELNTLFKLP